MWKFYLLKAIVALTLCSTFNLHCQYTVSTEIRLHCPSNINYEILIPYCSWVSFFVGFNNYTMKFSVFQEGDVVSCFASSPDDKVHFETID